MTRNPVEMRALRPFPRMEGQAIRRIKEGETFFAEPKHVDSLKATGKAEIVRPETADPDDDAPRRRQTKGA